jgi:hypothetical protein
LQCDPSGRADQLLERKETASDVVLQIATDTVETSIAEAKQFQRRAAKAASQRNTPTAKQ